MSVSICLREAEFSVKPENVAKINNIFLEYSARSFRCKPEEVENPDWCLSSDIDIDDYLANPKLGPTFTLELNTEYSSYDEETMFEEIAPFVEKGSWIELAYEGCDVVRVYFDGQESHWIEPEITWPIPDSCK